MSINNKSFEEHITCYQMFVDKDTRLILFKQNIYKTNCCDKDKQILQSFKELWRVLQNENYFY